MTRLTPSKPITHDVAVIQDSPVAEELASSKEPLGIPFDSALGE
jgi:hypothetical protein